MHDVSRRLFAAVFSFVFLFAFALYFAGTPAMAAGKRVIVTPNADYSGFDMQTVKDVDQAGCQTACLADNACRAFTFNTKAKWCFLKSDFGALSATPDAVAGRIVEAIDLTPSIERQRLAELDFLPTGFIDEARTLIGALKDRYAVSGGSYSALRTAAAIAMRDGKYDDAAVAYGRALAIASDEAIAWLDFSRASLARNPSDYSDRERATIDATAAAIDGYLRSDTTAARAVALALAGGALVKREEWKPAIKTYRASLALAETQSVRDAYDKLIADHGFRIVSHDVQADSATPQICIVFSDKLAVDRPDLADFVTVEGGSGLAVEPQESQICIDGVQHGSRYIVRVRAGLPAADGEKLASPAELSIYVRDREPWVGFAGNAYVLPAGPGATIPLNSVNTDKARATIYRIGDRGIVQAIRDGRFLSNLATYSAQTIEDETGEKVWQGEVDIASKLNQTMVTAIPVADAVPAMKPGVYVITAAPATDNPDQWGPLATQWFIVSDLGLTALSGHDGIHAIVRSLGTAEPVAGVKLRLVAVNNDVLGEAVTDAAGYARFEPGLARGTGGMAPQLVVAETDSDYAFLDLTRAAFDLTDRGVAGRAAPEALDAFLTPERGIYRPGEIVHLTALVRDARADAVTDLPMTLVVQRPDGVEFLHQTLSDGGLGGYSADVALQADAMRGSWTVQLFADPKGNAIAETSVLVEDFEPERLAVDLDTAAKTIKADAPVTIDLSARYLYGAPAPDLPIEGDLDIKAVDSLAAFPGYTFGLADDQIEASRQPLEFDAATDQDGKATFDVTLPTLPVTTHPLQAGLIIRVTDTNGRAVERTLDRPVEPTAPMIGVKPLFDGDLDEGANARFQAIMVAPDGTRMAKTGAKWKLERIERDYQWYRSDGRWTYELVTNTSRVAGGTVDFTVDQPTTIEGQVDWGKYRLTVEDDGDNPAASSVEFYAGWYRAVSSSDTPDTLQVALDKPAYRIGDTAKLRLDPRFAGIALISVIDDRLIEMKAVEVPESGTTVDLTVTDKWGPGAYVTATLYRPMDIAAKRMPSRALGLTWAKVDPGDRDLQVTADLPQEMRPRGPMTIPVSIGNLKPGEEAYVTVAAVDVGILNLTNFKAPAPDDWYFGQRKLGIEIRDIYGLLIDRTQGVPGTVRSGGDGGMSRLQAPPPTQKLLAFYSGIIRVDDAGKASVTFDVPDFNGTVRVMVVAWSKNGVGHASQDVFVRDPVVVTASIPRFLAVGDTSRLLVEINNVSGAAGDYTLSIATGEGIAFPDEDAAWNVTLAEKQRLSFVIPLDAKAVGDFDVSVVLAAPTGESWPTNLTLGVRPAGSPVTRRDAISVAAGGNLTVDGALTAEFVPGTASVGVSLGGAGPLDVAGILAALDRYPYGCVEQLTSRAMPLVYLDDVAASVGIAADKEIRDRVQKAIGKVLADQAASGAFGLWGPSDAGGDLWLNSYVTDFLTRAAEKGYDVPDVARTIALDNLANGVSYASDFDHGGEDVAYALYVLARAGRAAIGDLRYYTNSKLDAFSTPLAKAQIGAAMALYGDRVRAQRAFTAAMADLDHQEAEHGWRNDYGTSLRDGAAVLTLAAEVEVGSVDLHSLALRIAAMERNKRYTSTQEESWMLLAAAALIKDSAKTEFAIDGERIAAPLFRRYTGEALAAKPVTIVNLGDQPLEAVVSTTGVPLTPDPAGGNGYKIERTVYTPEGDPADIATVGQNDRFVVALTVTAEQDAGGRLLVVDRIPAGFEIENPDISASGSTVSLDWLNVDKVDHTEARTDRFVAAIDRADNGPTEYTLAYSVRAVSPGKFVYPAATVEDMYRPEYNARTATGEVEVVGATR